MRRPYPMPRVVTDSFPLRGGLLLNRSALDAKGGTLIECLNYEPYVAGGYERCKGYERFDGRPRPSDAVWQAVACTLNVGHGLVKGDSLTIGAVTCRFIAEVTGGMIVTKASGAIPTNTSITKSAVSKGTTDATDTTLDYSPTNLEDATWRNDAADQYRVDIAAVPGSGPVLGVWYYDDDVYAFRTNVGDTATDMYKATTGGWSKVDLGATLYFDAGQPAAIAVGDTVTGVTSGASAIVGRVEVQTGTWAAGTAAGILVFASVTNGPFQDNEALQVSATTRATANGASAAQSLVKDGSYQFINGNFYGSAETHRMYGCDGKNKAFEFDGVFYVPISTGMATDTPTSIEINSNHLFLSFGASAVHSEVGEPHKWDATFSAGEIGFGDDINGFIKLTGQAFGVIQRNKISAILGTSKSDWDVQTIAPDVGGIARTMQSMGAAVMIDDRGLIEVTPGQNYGNFDFATVSRQVQNLFDRYRNTFIASCIARNKNQYRAFTDDGTVLVMRVEPGQGREFTVLRYPNIPHCVCSEESTTGSERIFFGDGAGMVFEAERGTSFDGEPITAALVSWPSHARQPTVHKTYRHAWIEVQTELYSSIEVTPQYDYDAGDSQPALTFEDDWLFVARGSGGRWESTYFETFFWDSPYVSHFKLDISGSGYAIAFVILSESEIDQGHRVRAISYTYSPRHQRR